MTLKVCLTPLTNIIPCLSKLCMDIETRNETYVNNLPVFARIITIYLKWFIIRPVNAEESSVWIVPYTFKLPSECFSCRWEILPVRLIALVVRKQSLALLTVYGVLVPDEILDERRVVPNCSIKVAFYGESKFESHFIQVY